MKKLLSLMLVLCLLPMFSLAEHSIAANYIYQMILKQVDGTDFTRYDDDYEVMFFYPLSKHTYGDAVVRITAYEDGCTINVSYELPPRRMPSAEKAAFSSGKPSFPAKFAKFLPL